MGPSSAERSKMYNANAVSEPKVGDKYFGCRTVGHSQRQSAGFATRLQPRYGRHTAAVLRCA